MFIDFTRHKSLVVYGELTDFFSCQWNRYKVQIDTKPAGVKGSLDPCLQNLQANSWLVGGGGGRGFGFPLDLPVPD